MRTLFKILPLILITGWLASYQSAEHDFSHDSHGIETSSIQLGLSGAGNTLPHESTPFLPGRLAESVSENLHEVESDTKTELAKLSGSYFFPHDAEYLYHSVQSESFDSIRKLLFPFHTHL